MKQGILPLVPSGATAIDELYSVLNDGTTATWFLGSHPIRAHAASDHASQRSMMACLHVHGGVPQPRIAAALGVHENTVRAAVKRYRREGDAGFYAPTGVRGSTVLTPTVLETCRRLLGEGQTRAAVAAAVGIKRCTLDKAIQQGRLPPTARPRRLGQPSTRTERAAVDAAAAADLGMACVRVEERALAACGLLAGAEPRFEACVDVERGGVLCALPALAANGLFEYLPQLEAPRQGGFFYRLTQVFTLLALMALLRVKTVEALRRDCPGEFGRLLGLDRIPEVRCLRGRLETVAANPAAVGAWATALSKAWLAADPDLAGTLYIDGHVRVYYGRQTELPRRYVASHRLCLRGVTDYWVNDCAGKPFFYIDRPVDDGLLGVLRTEIVPRLLRDVPRQPAAAELQADPWLPRFRLIFDRAGCSFRFMAEMWRTHRIACLTYLKNPDADWPESEFRSVTTRTADGQTIDMELAERGFWFGNGREGIWCRQFRRLRRGPHGNHQTAIVSTDYTAALETAVPAMFARWGQENFFRYMLAEFGLDLLPDHATERFPCRVPVVNPAWRTLDAECRTLRGKLAVEKRRWSDLILEHDDLEPGPLAAWLERKSAIRDGITDLDHQLDATRQKRRQIPKHITFDELPAEHQFERLAPTRKLLLDTVRLIAYRAETALAALARPELSAPETARAMIKALLNTTADLRPDPQRKQLQIFLHPLAEPRLNRMAEAVLVSLNDAEFIYPGTDLRLVYQLLPSAAPPDARKPTT